MSDPTGLNTLNQPELFDSEVRVWCNEEKVGRVSRLHVPTPVLIARVGQWPAAHGAIQRAAREHQVP